MDENFKPIWLYIKRHSKTGLKYFGKTSSKNPVKYKGSGKYWLNHLRVHGNDIETIWTELFNDKKLLTEYAISFSKEHDIVNSDSWANLKFEDGLPGGFTGAERSDTTKRKLRISNLGKKQSEATKNKRKLSLNGKSPHEGINHSEETKQKIRVARQFQIMNTHNEETKKKMSDSWKNRELLTCPFCNLSSKNVSLMNRYHFDNCKKK
jgi:hypothetical protein